MPKKPLFIRIGGEGAVSAVVNDFYKALVADKRVSNFFASTNMEQLRKHQINFLTVAFGGPNAYTGKTVRAAHASLGITEADFDAVAENLVKVLKDLNVSQDMIDEVVEIVMSAKEDVVTAPPGGDTSVSLVVTEFHKTLQSLRPTHPDFGSGTESLIKALKSAGINQSLIDDVVRDVANVKNDIRKSQNKSLFVRLGGEGTISAVVEEFYTTLLCDTRVKKFFTSTNMVQLKQHQKAFLTCAFGGPNAYGGKDLRSVHADLGITEDDFDVVAEDLVKALKGVGVTEELIKEVVTIVGSVKGDIISAKPLFERLGGQSALDLVVDKLYDALLKDKRVSRFFSGPDIGKLKKHQKEFLMVAFGGSHSYKGRMLADARAGLGIKEQDFGVVAENVIKVLKDLGVEQTLIDEVAAILLSVKS